MIPIRLKRDNVLHLKQTAATGWPVCWKCKHIVEGIGVEPENEKAGLYVVTAECRHGTSTFFKDKKVITLHRSWSERKRQQRLAMLVFFAESAGEPMGSVLVAPNRTPIGWDAQVTPNGFGHPGESGPQGADRPRIIVPTRW